MAEHVWLNGTLVPATDAKVSAFDHGITVGDGIFETLRATDRVVWAPRRHLARLRRSAAILGIEVPCSDDELLAAMQAVLDTHDLSLARVRITVTAGHGPLGSDRAGATPTVMVAVAPLPSWPESTSVCVVPWVRNERGAMAGAKTTSYAENVVALAYAKERGCTEAILANTVGMLCEGTGSNVFCVFDGQVITPPLSAGCLAGVTRELVLEITDAIEEDIAMRAFLLADEVFLTSTGRWVQPVHQIDGRRLLPGKTTTRIAKAFATLCAGSPDP